MAQLKRQKNFQQRFRGDKKNFFAVRFFLYLTNFLCQNFFLAKNFFKAKIFKPLVSYYMVLFYLVKIYSYGRYVFVKWVYILLMGGWSTRRFLKVYFSTANSRLIFIPYLIINDIKLSFHLSAWIHENLVFLSLNWYETGKMWGQSDVYVWPTSDIILFQPRVYLNHNTK